MYIRIKAFNENIIPTQETKASSNSFSPFASTVILTKDMTMRTIKHILNFIFKQHKVHLRCSELKF